MSPNVSRRRRPVSARPSAGWPAGAGVGKTVVTSRTIDRVTARHAGRSSKCRSASSGSPGLFEGRLCFGGEESAGASLLRRNGEAWTTDKDGIVMGLLAAEMTARTAADPSQHYRALEDAFGAPSLHPRRCASFPGAEGQARGALSRGHARDRARG